MGGLFVLDENDFKLSVKQFEEGFQKNFGMFPPEEINQKLVELKKNENNLLLKYINEFSYNNSDEEEWLLNDQSTSARNDTMINIGNSQCIDFGICGTHSFYP